VSESIWPSAPTLDALGLDTPIIQAPMAGAGSIELTQAVQAAGGLGSLPCATLNHAQVESHLKTLKTSSNAPFNVNFFTHHHKPESAEAQAHWTSSLSEEYKQWSLDPSESTPSATRAPFDAATCELIERYPPTVVSFHFGLPAAELVARVKAAGCQVWSSATTPLEAQWLEEHGADAIIAQGFEAGGHRGLFLNPLDGTEVIDDDINLIAHQVGTFSLVPQVVDAVSVPVIAAGGIGDGRSVAAALALGASAVQIGTAFLFSSEATITAMHRAALLNGRAEKTVLTNVFSGKPARSAINHVIKTQGPMSPNVPPFPTAANALAPLKAVAEKDNKADYSSLWSGQSANLAARLVEKHHGSTAPPSATELLQWIAEDAQSIIAGLR